MKKITITLIILCFLLPLCCPAQSPRYAAFTNDTGISGTNGFFRDSLDNYFLYKMQEPVLSNYYLGKDMYRLTLTSDFTGRALIIKIERSENGISITTKEMRRARRLPKDRMASVKNQYELYTFDINKKKHLDKAKYNKLTQLADSIFAHPSAPDKFGIDGADRTIEISTKAGYFSAKKWSPQKGDPVKEIGDLMIDLSALKHKRSIKKL